MGEGWRAYHKYIPERVLSSTFDLVDNGSVAVTCRGIVIEEREREREREREKKKGEREKGDQ